MNEIFLICCNQCTVYFIISGDSNQFEGWSDWVGSVCFHLPRPDEGTSKKHELV